MRVWLRLHSVHKSVSGELALDDVWSYQAWKWKAFQYLCCLIYCSSVLQFAVYHSGTSFHRFIPGLDIFWSSSFNLKFWWSFTKLYSIHYLKIWRFIYPSSHGWEFVVFAAFWCITFLEVYRAHYCWKFFDMF